MRLIDIPVYELAEKLKNREISSLELTKDYLSRIEEVEDKVSSYISILKEFAIDNAKEADKRLSTGDGVTNLTGIPISIKDNMCLKGFRTTCASKILENFIPPYNATVVERLMDAGAVFLGKANMDEFAMGSSTENSRFFNTYNPWDIHRVPGGSSGGAAASIAAREAALALGSDTGGSVRQPAAFCGVSCIKPTYGVISRYGLIAFASSLDQIGPLGKNIKDVAIMMDIIAGEDSKDSTSANIGNPSFYDSIKDADNIEGIKIGIPKEFFSEGLEEDIKESLYNALEILKGLGAKTVEVSIPSLDYSLAAYYIIAPSEASSNLARYDGCRYGYRNPDDTDIISMYKKTRREGFGDEVLRRIMTGTYCLSSGYYDAYYLKAQKIRTLIKNDFDNAFKECDLIFSPATPSKAFKIGEKKDDPISMYLSDIYTVSLNMAGLPGVVVPSGFSEGLPIGMQLIGKAFDEVTLLKVASVFQETTDYHKNFPKIIAY